MKLFFNLLILVAILGLAYLLVNSIKEPIKFREEKDKREAVVSHKLKQIRTCQEMYRDIRGKFASSFDSLEYTLNNDSIPFQQVFEDPDDPTNEDKFIRKTIYSSAKDSIQALGITLGDLRYVPFTEKKVQFNIAADTLTYQKTLVSVCEVGTVYKDFMGLYANPLYSKYDNSYDPNKTMKFGSMNAPNLTGNWE